MEGRASGLRDGKGRDRRHRALLSQAPQPGRVCFRPWLGGSLPPGRRALLSEIAVIGSLHAGDGPAPVFGERRNARASGQGLVSVCKELKASSAHITFLPEADWRARGQGPVAAAAGHSVPLAKPGLRDLSTISLPAFHRRKRKNIRKERKAVLEAGISFDWVTGKESRKAIGMHFLISTWKPARANGARLI